MILGQTAFAHRGLWAPDGAPENSIAAFQAAATAGVGIELDVQLTKDGVPVVFHDPALERMTDATGPVWERTAEDLATLTLAGTSERIPTLSEVARALPAGTPVLVELKASPVDPNEYLQAIDLALFASRIDFAVMSFIQSLNRATAALMAGRVRGALVPPGDTEARTRISTASTASPDYFAINHVDIGSARTVLGDDTPLAAWTVDTLEAVEAAHAANAAVIFEHVTPDLALGRSAL